MINKRVKDKKSSQMVLFMKDSLKKEKKMDLENILGVMDKCMKAILKLIIFKEKGYLFKIIFLVNILGVMEDHMKENGLMEE